VKKVVIFYGHLERVAAIWYISRPFDNLVEIWCIFPRFGTLNKEKSGNPAIQHSRGHAESLKNSGRQCDRNCSKVRSTLNLMYLLIKHFCLKYLIYFAKKSLKKVSKFSSDSSKFVYKLVGKWRI
jgi:hypothetical protein